MILRVLPTVAMLALTVPACLDNVDLPDRGQQSNDPDPNDPDPNDPDPNDPDPNDPDPNDPDPNDPDPNDPDPNEPDPNDPDPNEPDPNEPDPNEPDPNEPDPNDPDTLASRAWCAPAAADYVPNLVLPTIPEEVLADCGLVETATFVTYNDRTTTVRYTWQGSDLWVEYGDNGSSWNLLKVSYNAARVRTQVTYGRQRSGQFAFASWEDAWRYTYDDAGQLTEFAIVRGNTTHVYVTQRWADGRLVERNEERNVWDAAAGQSVATPFQSLWAYDGGRLASATATGLGHVWTSRWTYDADGRPSEVVRLRDDKTVARMTWAYDADNRLARRTAMSDTADAYQEGFGPWELDTFGKSIVDYWNGDPWANSTPRLTDAGCVMPPTSLDYGYPGHEVTYQLGMPVEERPNGIGWAYGADTYGWNYGDLAWYSHAGVNGFEPQYRNSNKLESEILYRSGVMVEEHVTSDGPVTDTHRVRSFEGPRLLVDRNDITVVVAGVDGAPSVTRVYGRELLFTWQRQGDGEGDALVKRELADDELGVLEWQTTTHDAAGRWLSHTVYGDRSWGNGARIPLYAYEDPCAAGSGSECPAREIGVRQGFIRTLDDAGRTLARANLYPGENGELVEQQRDTYTYDEAGRVLTQQSNGGYLQTFEYDAAGKQTYAAWDYDGNGEPDGYTTAVYDERGFLLTSETWSAGQLSQRTTNTYSCQ